MWLRLEATYPSGQGAGLQNLYSPVRIRSSPPSLRMGVIAAGLLGAGQLGCSDPPPPPPTSDGAASYVLWLSLEAPRRGPIVIVWDRPGGPVERLLAEPELTTFLNRRFSPSLLDPGSAGPSLEVVDESGCWRLTPWRPASSAEITEALNRAELGRAAGEPGLPRPALSADLLPGAPLDHPLRLSCTP